MWNAQHQQIPNGQRLRIKLTQTSAPLSYAAVIHGWQKDCTFRDFFIELLGAVPFTAFRWETPAITNMTVDRSFECVFLSSPGLARSPDPKTFEQHFPSNQSVVTFSNLGKDAILVAPCPHQSFYDYSHLGAFSKHAPKSQQHDLWQAVGHTMEQRLGPTPVWLSTAGGGVAWLHIRLDDFPKYYHHLPYQSYEEN